MELSYSFRGVVDFEPMSAEQRRVLVRFLVGHQAITPAIADELAPGWREPWRAVVWRDGEIVYAHPAMLEKFRLQDQSP